MSVLQDLGIDAIADVSIPQEDWHATALRMIQDRRAQVTNAWGRATAEWQKEALIVELKRMADLETYVNACLELFLNEQLCVGVGH